MIEIIKSPKHLEKILKNWLLSNYSLTEMKKMRVFLKPNIGYPKTAPFTTNLDVIYSVVKVLDELNFAEIIIGEGSTSKNSAIDNFTTVGLQKKLIDFQVTYLDTNTLPATKIDVNNEYSHYLPTILQEIELKISIPVIKIYDDDEGQPFLSNAVKNFFGLPPKANYRKDSDSYKRDSLHSNLHKSVAEIYAAVEQFAPFDLFICDGLNILKGEAETGEPKEWNRIIVSDEAIEADLFVLKLLEKPMPRFLQIITEKEK